MTSRDRGGTLAAMTLFAHSSSTRFEPLEDHLKTVAGLAQRFAADFGGGDLGYLAGAYHDLGKAKPRFQAKLKGEKNDEPHSAEGAKAILETYNGIVGRLIAPAIMGHHSGMPNGLKESVGKPPTPFDVRCRQAEDIRPIVRLARSPKLELSRPTSAFDYQFLMRMLFSCLVDADFIATENWLRDAEPARFDDVRRTPWKGGIADLRAVLDARLGDFGAPERDVDLLRAEVLADARARAREPAGLFTMTVPTGGGKTLASMAFALDHALRHDMRRVVYVIPFTSIVEQTADIFRGMFGDDAVLEHHSAFDWDGFAGRDREDANGAEKLRLAAQNWDRPVVVTTAVQFFESLFSNRPSKCRKLHHLARAVIVFDEAQTLPLKVLRPCIAAMETLSRAYRSSVVLCTATQPAIRVSDGFKAPEALKDETVREIAGNPTALYERLKRVRVERRGVLDDGVLASAMIAERQVLCIVNNRKHARALFKHIEADGDALHLSTTMTAKHRRAVLTDVRQRLAEAMPLRLVATSLVEAGVDISFPVVWRALAGIEQLNQAAGRCNRNNELGREGGRLVVFEPAPDENHRPPDELIAFAEKARHTLDAHADPLTLEALRHYFGEVYWGYGDAALDGLKVGSSSYQGIMTAIKETAGEQLFCFADIAHAFRLIEDNSRPVIIAGGAWGAPDDLMRELDHSPFAGRLARKFQPYVVSVPRRVRTGMIAAGAAEIVRQAEFGDQFVRLPANSYYGEHTGLDWASAAEGIMFDAYLLQ